MAYEIKINQLIELTNPAETLEQLGTKAKFWLKLGDGQSYLFKRGRSNTGEDWAEVVSSAICDIINLPHARYCFAKNLEGQHGVLTKSIVPPKARLILGNELLHTFDEKYDTTKTYSHTDYRLQRVFALLRNLNGLVNVPKTNTLREIEKASDVFVGYLMFDALIGNQDRHHENWGLILSSDSTLYLAETFDHASSLGRNESDEKRTKILTTNDKRGNISAYCQRAITPFYNHGAEIKRLLTIEAFSLAAKWRPAAAKAWLGMLEKINSDNLNELFAQLPNTAENKPSEIAQKFAIAMIIDNKKRLQQLEI